MVNGGGNRSDRLIIHGRSCPLIEFKPPKCIAASAVREVARDCGDLSIECTNASTAVGEVSSRLAASLNCLVALQDIAGRLKLDQADVSWSTDEARLLALHAQQKLAVGRRSIEGCIAEFAELADLVVRLGDRIMRFVDPLPFSTRLPIPAVKPTTAPSSKWPSLAMRN